MLHSESRFSCKKGFYTLTSIILVAFLLTGCGQGNRHKDLTIEAFSEFKKPLFVINGNEVRHLLLDRCNEIRANIVADKKIKQYYTDGGQMLWVDKQGINDAARSLVSHLHESVPEIGLDANAFYINQIDEDIERMDSLDFDEGDNSINYVLARLEVNLMRACARYVVGQRYGFVNPNYIFNRLDSMTSNHTGRFTGFRLLYDLKSERPGEDFMRDIASKIKNDSISQFLAEIQPQDTLYNMLKRMLPTASGNLRRQILVNMERCRWRYEHNKSENGKSIIVNIPAFRLWEYKSGICVADMKIGCGSTKTKTPVLHSMVERVEVNPQWHIPMSIITKDIVQHIGDSAYFQRNNYYIVSRKTGNRIALENITAAMLYSGEYGVIQEGGEGNSLGRIVFRFKNNMSIYLHDTNSRGFFNQTIRAVSHGCVRVERPFDLGVFVLGENTDEWTLDKIRISMDMPPTTDKGKKYVKTHGDDKNHLISVLAAKPQIPVYILYFTLFPDANGKIESYHDIYGYDTIMLAEMNRYINN